MKNHYDLSSECLSEQQQDSSQDLQYIKTLQRMKKMKEIGQQIQRQYNAEDEEPNILKPKIQEDKLKGRTSQLTNGSRLFQNKSCVRLMGGSAVGPVKKTVEVGGVRKTGGGVGVGGGKPKGRSDPVSLFQKTQSAWKSNRFLKSGADNKEGRKLNLNMRNKSSVYL